MEKITLGKVKSIASRISSKVKSDRKDPTGNQNCQLCTWCSEAQFRGVNVLPRPVYSPRDIIFKFKGDDIVKGGGRQHFKTIDDLKSILEKAEDGARFYAHVKWRQGNGGHEFIVINVDGKSYLMDSQAGKVIDAFCPASYFNKSDLSMSYILRMDTKDFNKDILKYNDMKYCLEWDEEKDMKYLEEN